MDEQPMHLTAGGNTCPGCGKLHGLGLAGQSPPFGRACICQSGALLVCGQDGSYRLPTDTERVRIEASGLGQSLREDLTRLREWRATGELPEKRHKLQGPEPIFD